MVIKALLCCAALGANNFGFQAVTGKDWTKALERTAFQMLAVYLTLITFITWR